jgi:hypothetical protein
MLERLGTINKNQLIKDIRVWMTWENLICTIAQSCPGWTMQY